MSQTVDFYIETFTPQYVSAPKKDDYIIIAEEITGTCFGEQRNFAVALRVMHWFAANEIQGGDNSTGDDSGNGDSMKVQRDREGRVEKEYYAPSTSNNYEELSSTRWGQQLYDLIQGSILSVGNRFSVC